MPPLNSPPTSNGPVRESQTIAPTFNPSFLLFLCPRPRGAGAGGKPAPRCHHALSRLREPFNDGESKTFAFVGS